MKIPKQFLVAVSGFYINKKKKVTYLQLPILHEWPALYSQTHQRKVEVSD